MNIDKRLIACTHSFIELHKQIFIIMKSNYKILKINRFVIENKKNRSQIYS